MEQLINNLFSALAAIFPAWRNAFQSQQELAEAKRQWLAALVENQITTSEQLNHGIKKARSHSSPFLPSCGMFVSWCQEYTLIKQEFPSEQEFRKALVSEIGKFFNDRDWSQYHPAVYYAYLQRTSSDWKEIGTERFERVTEKLYRAAKDLVLAGHNFPVYTKEQLEAPIAQEKSDPVVAKAAIENILKEFGN